MDRAFGQSITVAPKALSGIGGARESLKYH